MAGYRAPYAVRRHRQAWLYDQGADRTRGSALRRRSLTNRESGGTGPESRARMGLSGRKTRPRLVDCAAPARSVALMPQISCLPSLSGEPNHATLFRAYGALWALCRRRKDRFRDRMTLCFKAKMRARDRSIASN